MRLPFFGRGSCHGAAGTTGTSGLRKLAIVGSPNVGKSVIFNRLTGAYATVSNYPGTTVTVSRGKARINGSEYEVMDTPGMYSLSPITEEESVARSILMEERPSAVVQVVDGKDLERMLPLSLQLLEAGLPLFLVINMMDEAEAAGVRIETQRLEEELGVPVVATVATTGRGMAAMKEKLSLYVCG